MASTTVKRILSAEKTGGMLLSMGYHLQPGCIPFELPWHVDVCVCAPSMWGSLQWQPQLDEDCWIHHHTDGCTLSTIWCGGWLLPPLHSTNLSILTPRVMWDKVRNTRVGGLLVCAPPCSTWVFLSSFSTGRGWSNPGGNSSTCVLLANIMVRRLLCMLPGWFICYSTLTWISECEFIWYMPSVLNWDSSMPSNAAWR